MKLTSKGEKIQTFPIITAAEKFQYLTLIL